MRATQKFGEHEQASTRLNFASKSSKGKILRAVKNFNGPFITPYREHLYKSGDSYLGPEGVPWVAVSLYPYFKRDIEQDAVHKLLFIKEDTEKIGCFFSFWQFVIVMGRRGVGAFTGIKNTTY